MLKIIAFIVIGALLMSLARWGWTQIYSFKAQKLTDYSDLQPLFDIKSALNGPILSEGVIYDFTGRVNSRFKARMHGAWDGDNGVLTEDFEYDSGRFQHRQWTLEMGEDGHFTTTAPDIIGIGEGRQLGAAVRLAYRIRLDEAAGGHVLDVVDWMYLVGDGVIINKSEFRKFGFKVGELVATMRKVN